MCFFSPFGIFFSYGRGPYLVISAPWHTGSPSGPNTQVWAPAEVRGTCSGGWKWHVRSGRHSEHVEPSRPMQTRVHNIINRLKKCPTSHVISGTLNAINVVRHYILGDGKVFPWHVRHATMYTIPGTWYSINLRPSFAKLINYKPTYPLWGLYSISAQKGYGKSSCWPWQHPGESPTYILHKDKT